LQILDDFEDTPSVDPNDPETPEQYRSLVRIPLRTHSINVAKKVVDFMSRRHNDFQKFAGKAILAALAHDIGVKEKPLLGVSHSVNSSCWCERELKSHANIKDLIESIRHHHTEDKKLLKNNLILMALVRANKETRAEELAALKEVEKKAAQKILPVEKPQAMVPSKETEKDSKIEDKVDQENDNPITAVGQTEESTDETVPEKMANVPVQEMAQSYEWLTDEKLYGALARKVAQGGFRAFVFEDKVYFQPKVIRATLEEMAETNNDSTFLQVIAHLIDPLIEGFGFVNHRAKLRFAGKVPPKTSYFFIIDRCKIPLPSDYKDITPREISVNFKNKNDAGRFLKKIIIMEGK